MIVGLFVTMLLQEEAVASLKYMKVVDIFVKTMVTILDLMLTE